MHTKVRRYLFPYFRPEVQKTLKKLPSEVWYCTFVVTVGPMNVYVYASSCIVVRVYKSCLCVPLYTCSTTYTYCTNKYFESTFVRKYFESTFVRKYFWKYDKGTCSWPPRVLWPRDETVWTPKAWVKRSPITKISTKKYFSARGENSVAGLNAGIGAAPRWYCARDDCSAQLRFFSHCARMFACARETPSPWALQYTYSYVKTFTSLIRK